MIKEIHKLEKKHSSKNNKVIVENQLFIKLPSYDIITISYLTSNKHSIKIKDIKQLILQQTG